MYYDLLTSMRGYDYMQVLVCFVRELFKSFFG